LQCLTAHILEEISELTNKLKKIEKNNNCITLRKTKVKSDTSLIKKNTSNIRPNNFLKNILIYEKIKILIKQTKFHSKIYILE